MKINKKVLIKIINEQKVYDKKKNDLDKYIKDVAMKIYQMILKNFGQKFIKYIGASNDSIISDITPKRNVHGEMENELKLLDDIYSLWESNYTTDKSAKILYNQLISLYQRQAGAM